ncbi:MAG TPA: PTS sugar transporter subunit IIA [Luteimonas sp.]|nr:PTS sugar transporter subunit IIA [Luteimonas sp.]
MPFTDLLSADRVVLLVDPTHRDQVLDAAARLLSGQSPVVTQALGEGLRAREQLGSTGIGHGVAIPHCRSNASRDARAAFLRLGRPVDFSASDGQPVDLVFAMSVPEDLAQEHLQTLSELAVQFSDAAFREALRGAADVAALQGVLLDLKPARVAMTATMETARDDGTAGR